MQRALRVVAVASLGAVAVTVLVTTARSRRASPAEPENAVTTTTLAPASAIVPARITQPSPAAPPPSQEHDDARKTRITKRIDDAREHLVSAAAPCWRAHAKGRLPRSPGPSVDDTTGFLRVRYRLATGDGSAHVEEPSVIESSNVAPDLERCIVDAVRDAHWAADDVPDLITVEELLRMGDLTTPELPVR